MGRRIFPLMLIFFAANNLSSQTDLNEARQLLQNEKYQEAANHCQQMIKANENAGGAYLLLGDVYFQSRMQCGESGWRRQTPVLLAFHAYEQGKKVSKKLTKMANSKLKQICPYLPSSEQIFNRALEEGDSYAVQCWETTTTIINPKNCSSKYGK